MTEFRKLTDKEIKDIAKVAGYTKSSPLVRGTSVTTRKISRSETGQFIVSDPPRTRG